MKKTSRKRNHLLDMNFSSEEEENEDGDDIDDDEDDFVGKKFVGTV